MRVCKPTNTVLHEIKGSQRFLFGPQPANTCSHTKLSIQAKRTTPVSRVTPAMIPVWFPNLENICSKLRQVTDVLRANTCFTRHKSASLTRFWGNHKTTTEGGNCKNFSHRQWVVTHCSLNILCIVYMYIYVYVVWISYTKSKLKLKATFKIH